MQCHMTVSILYHMTVYAMSHDCVCNVTLLCMQCHMTVYAMSHDCVYALSHDCVYAGSHDCVCNMGGGGGRTCLCAYYICVYMCACLLGCNLLYVCICVNVLLRSARVVNTGVCAMSSSARNTSSTWYATRVEWTQAQHQVSHLFAPSLYVSLSIHQSIHSSIRYLFLSLSLSLSPTLAHSHSLTLSLMNGLRWLSFSHGCNVHACLLGTGCPLHSDSTVFSGATCIPYLQSQPTVPSQSLLAGECCHPEDLRVSFQ